MRLRRCLLASTSRAETHFPKENASCRGASLHWLFLFYLPRQGIRPVQGSALNQVRTRSHKRGRNAHISVGKAHSPQGMYPAAARLFIGSCDRSCTCLFVLLASARIRTWSRLRRESGSQVRRKPLSACKHKARRDSLPTAMYPAKLQSNFRALPHGSFFHRLYILTFFDFLCYTIFIIIQRRDYILCFLTT